mgnify:CR=1 FL=1
MNISLLLQMAADTWPDRIGLVCDGRRWSYGALLRAWQAAHAYARREPRTADAWLAAQQGLSLAEFGSVQRGLVYQPLQEQVTLLAPGGAMEQNLRAVQRVQARVGLVPVNQALPPVSNGPLRQALQRP